MFMQVIDRATMVKTKGWGLTKARADFDRILAKSAVVAATNVYSTFSAYRIFMVARSCGKEPARITLQPIGGT